MLTSRRFMRYTQRSPSKRWALGSGQKTCYSGIQVSQHPGALRLTMLTQMHHISAVTKLLGQTIPIRAQGAQELSIALREYLETRKDQGVDLAHWPLIRHVDIFCPADALRTGAVLVDLPGVADLNSARNSIAQNFMEKCHHFWIVAPVHRAVDDRTALGKC